MHLDRIVRDDSSTPPTAGANAVAGPGRDYCRASADASAELAQQLDEQAAQYRLLDIVNGGGQ